MVSMDDLGKYETIVGYGIGQNYEVVKHRLANRIPFSFLADKKWEHSDLKTYDGIPVIHMQELKRLKNVLVVLFPKFSTVRDVIARELEETDADICYIHDLFPTEYFVSSDELIGRLPEKRYCDEFHNRIIYDETIPRNIRIHFEGGNNLLKIGKNLSVNSLDIFFGNNGSCGIGDGTSVVQASCFVANAELEIGKDCMLSSGIIIRTQDDHHIFDMETHRRINMCRDVVIENQVWLGYETLLLAGAHIGAGSVVGARAVTSSVFGSHVLIAGCPAKVIRENVCWSRDLTGHFQRNNLEECMDQNALKYM